LSLRQLTADTPSSKEWMKVSTLTKLPRFSIGAWHPSFGPASAAGGPLPRVEGQENFRILLFVQDLQPNVFATPRHRRPGYEADAAFAG
jgi:hypothetical protein